MPRSAAAVSLMSALLAAAATAPHYLFVNPDDAAAKELADAGFLDLNREIANPKNKKEFAARLNEAGVAAANTDQAGQSAPTNGNGNGNGNSFAIINFELPKIARKGGGGARKSKYPTDQLQPGQAFFIPVGDDVKSPSKTYGSIASLANRKYGDLAAGADFRYFETRSLDDGAPFGEQYKGKRGIVVGRLSTADAMKKRDHLIANPPKPRKRKDAAPAE